MFYEFYKEFYDNMDLVINESKKPILIIGNKDDEKVTYLSNKYKTYIVQLGQVFAYSKWENDLISSPEKKPGWYANLLTLCEENKDDKCLIIFDDLENAKNNVLVGLYAIILNEDGDFNLPENATIVCTMNGYGNLPVAPLSLPKPFLECFTILNGQDKDNIEIKWNNNRTK